LSKIKLNKSFKIVETLQDDDETDFEIQFRITDACNLKCSYCHWNKGKMYSTPDIMICLDKIETFLKKMDIKSCTFYFHGGEPSTHPDLELICKRIKNISTRTVIEVQTNLIKDISYIQEIDYISVSLHYLELQRTNNIKVFLDNYNKITKINNLDIMLEDIYTDEYYDFIKNLLKKDVKNSEMIYGYFGGLLTNHKEFYDKYNKSTEVFNIDGKIYNTNDLFSKGLDCTGCKCCTTRTQMYCNGNGDLYYCATHLTQGNPYINIIDKEIPTIIYKIDIECKYDNCIDFFVERYK